MKFQTKMTGSTQSNVRSISQIISVDFQTMLASDTCIFPLKKLKNFRLKALKVNFIR